MRSVFQHDTHKIPCRLSTRVGGGLQPCPTCNYCRIKVNAECLAVLYVGRKSAASSDTTRTKIPCRLSTRVGGGLQPCPTYACFRKPQSLSCSSSHPPASCILSPASFPLSTASFPLSTASAIWSLFSYILFSLSLFMPLLSPLYLVFVLVFLPPELTKAGISYEL